MPKQNPTRRELSQQVEDLQLRLAESEDTLRAIRAGEVDAIAVSGTQGEQVSTLEGAEEPYRILVETMDEGTVNMRPDGTIAYSNRRFAEMVQAPLEQVIGSRFSRFLSPPQEPAFSTLLEQSGKDGNKQEFTLFTGNAGADIGPAPETPVKTPVPALISVRPLHVGRGTGYCLVITNLTAQKQALAAVSVERERLFAILEELPAMVCLITPDYRIAFMNRAFRKRFGDPHGRRCYEHCFGLKAPCTFCGHVRVLATGRPCRSEVTLPDGHVIQAHDLPFTDVDGSPLMLEMNFDVTEWRQAEKKLKEVNSNLERRVAERTAELDTSNRELDSFASSVAHDLRSPLRAIDGFSLALVEDYGPQLDAAAREYLERIRAGAVRMGGLIDDLLNLSHLARVDFCREEVDLSGLAGSVAGVLSKTEAGHDVEFAIEAGVVAQGDLNLLRIALERLLGNACKFSAPRQPARVGFGAVVEKGRTVYFVRDNGVGFDMAYVGKLFTPFQRLHGGSEFPGHGIGLAMVDRIIRKHGGKVWAEGAVNRGATFYFTLGGSESKSDENSKTETRNLTLEIRNSPSTQP